MAKSMLDEPRLNARDVLKALERRHARSGMQAHEWAFVSELRISPLRTKVERQVARYKTQGGEETDWSPLDVNERRIDAWAMRVRRRHCIAYEIKVTRQDFLRELEDETKRAAGMLLSNEFYFATPPHLIDPMEIPEGCGLIEASKRRQHGSSLSQTVTRIVVQAPWRDIDDLPWQFIASIAMRAA